MQITAHVKKCSPTGAPDRTSHALTGHGHHHLHHGCHAHWYHHHRHHSHYNYHVVMIIIVPSTSRSSKILKTSSLCWSVREVTATSSLKFSWIKQFLGFFMNFTSELSLHLICTYLRPKNICNKPVDVKVIRHLPPSTEIGTLTKNKICLCWLSVFSVLRNCISYFDHFYFLWLGCLSFGWVTSPRNGPMDSLDVGKAVIVKESWTYPGFPA